MSTHAVVLRGLVSLCCVVPATAVAQRGGPWCPSPPAPAPVRRDAASPDPTLAMRLGALVVAVRSEEDRRPVLRDVDVRIWGPRGDVRSAQVDTSGHYVILRQPGASRLQVRRLRYKHVDVRVHWRAGYRDTLLVDLPPLHYCLERVGPG